MRLLLVEDQTMAADYIAKGLRENDFVVDVAHDGVDGLHFLLTNDYDLAILDVMLPGMNGWKILELARQAGKMTPVMFLTARDDVEDRVCGLELGAEDYLIKPFSFSELLARVRVIMRRGAPHAASSEEAVLQISDLQLDFLKHRASRNGKRIELTQKEFLLLSLLMRRRGEVLSRTVLAEQVWDMNFDPETNVIDVAVRRLRSKIDDGYEVKLLHTIRGAGYVLEERNDADSA
ncbi:heavy metal response regulator transcription factor [Raoultella ornithinolytica]|jgi:two-component system copper resistance phosphate regulon response regulator CusR|uniref:heavy metal response regulator transcription factor n=1 Tax=Raoultella TaxID=160674 RepID=UPI0002CCF6D2|nr:MULTISPECIES: heavy metal response regulator transcription factor [Raoultella]HDX8329171.1 heavy metal response regulator transcription factor [Raoultella ornithinolytica CD1_MRS_4]AGJ87233.1 two-component response regulator [Raoultella ornithinolytica B6]AOO57151.1 transcriptional regulator [Raoultella ornithinolytica]APB04730.1 response regulator [Raoultella ornithinolytica]ATM22380.1 DNA-binding response regulator [Raoultella ornithinolytica]